MQKNKEIITKKQQNNKRITKSLIEQDYQNESLKKININQLDTFLIFKTPNLQPAKHSTKKFSQIECFAANTHQGLVRNYNEDRVSIILNIAQPPDKILKPGEIWPNCSFFGVYDGHGGKKCAEFLRDNLHTYIIKNQDFPNNPKQAIQSACKLIEEIFIQEAIEKQPIERSGSCANFIFIINEFAYSCNIGDSRSLISIQAKIEQLTIDHKPLDPIELKRIISSGGQVYQSFGQKIQGTQFNGAQILGPHRIFPGGLSVSRAFGDIESKLDKYGGKPNIIIAKPDIKQILIDDSIDFILLACDGIYDRMNNEEISSYILNPLNQNYQNIHQFAGAAVDNLIINAFKKKALDNITAILIGFKNFASIFKKFQDSNLKYEQEFYNSQNEQKEKKNKLNIQ